MLKEEEQLHRAIYNFKLYGDTPAVGEVAQAISALIDAKIASHTAKPPFLCSDTVTDLDFEALLTRYPPIIYAYKPPEAASVTYLGPVRPSCIACGAMTAGDGSCPNPQCDGL
jgi:hypothetical protein